MFWGIVSWFMLHTHKPKFTTQETHYSDNIKYKYSDFVTNSYGESWDSSCQKSWVPVKKKSLESEIENALAFM